MIGSARSGIELRPLHREDIASVAEIAAKAFASEVTGSLVTRTLRIHCDTVDDAPLHAQTDVLVATEYYVLRTRQPAEAIGLAGLYRHLWCDPAVMFLGWFCIHPAHQRRGLGRLLLQTTMKLAVDRGASRMLIETSPDAHPARCLYERLGFERCGEVPDYFAAGAALLLLSRSLVDPPLQLPEGSLDVIC